MTKNKILKRMTGLVLVFLVLLSSQSSYALEWGRICQGNTLDVGDCVAVYDALYNSGTYNTSCIQAVGWTKTASGGSLNTNRAEGSDLSSAKLYELVYFSTHGSNNGKMNVATSDPSKMSGICSPFDVSDQMGVTNTDWLTNCVWSGPGNYTKAVILASCYQLDNSGTGANAKHWARVMKASQLKVVLGYHESAPAHPTDTNIATDLFSLASTKSAREAWRIANTSPSRSSVWCSLVFNDGNYEDINLPGFGSFTLSPAGTTPSTTVRYYNSVNSPQIIVTSVTPSLPLTINTKPSSSVIATYSTSINTKHNEHKFIGTSIDLDYHRSLADEFMSKEYEDILMSSIPVEFNLFTDEVDSDYGVLDGSKKLIGKSVVYTNQFMGVKLMDNFLAITVEGDNVSIIKDSWQTVSIEVPKNTAVYSTDECNFNTFITTAEKTNNIDIVSGEYIYVPVGNGTYKLAYEAELADGSYTILDCSSSVGELFTE